MSKQTSLISRILREERGNVATIFALSAIPVLGVVGLAIDYSNAMGIRSKIQAAADAAAITAMRNEDQSDDVRIETAEKAFAANVAELNGSTLSIEPTITMANKRIKVSATAKVPTKIGAVVGVPSIDVGAESSVGRGSGQLSEVALMIDLTGSMGQSRNGQTKIAGLRDAGANLLNILLPNGSSSTDTRVSIVPFADYVNAGDYAAAATGLPTSGSYTPATDLAGTKNGVFTGTYSGLTGSTPGTEWGVTPPYISYPGQTSPAGAVYNNDYCGAKPTTVAVDKINGVNVGFMIPANRYHMIEPNRSSETGLYTATIPPNLMRASPDAPAYLTFSRDDVPNYDAYQTNGWRYISKHKRPSDFNGTALTTYAQKELFATVAHGSLSFSTTPVAWTGDYVYAPKISNPGSLRPWMHTGKGMVRLPSEMVEQTNTGPVGYMVIDVDQFMPNRPASGPPGAVKVENNGYGGVWHLDRFAVDDAQPGQGKYIFAYGWKTTGWYYPLYELPNSAWSQSSDGQWTLNVSSTGSSTNANCSTTPAKGPLITCVTERTGPEDYTDANPSSNPVGAYNHGDHSISNYSSDGKCWTAGRELAKVIPLTNDKKTLGDFFKNAEFGGGGAGHIGTAWAWYTLSPNWSSIWPSASKPGDYNNKAVSKTAVLVVDGEYNIEYSSDTSRTQALALCKAMKDKGITLYTVGYGLYPTATASDNTTEGKAKDLLTQCASSAEHAYFPYDGAELNTALAKIGKAIKSPQAANAASILN